MRQTAILVIEDERRYRELLDISLSRRGYRVLQAATGAAGVDLVAENEPDLVLLDLMLPDMDGYEVCGRIRALSKVPIIMLTARVEERDKVRGLRAGADDYVTKPFSAEELLARIEAVLRRSDAGDTGASPPLVCGDLRVDFTHHQVTMRGHDVELPPTEYRLLEQLAANVGRVMVQEELLRRVWGPGYENAGELLHTAIRRLRTHVEDDPAAPRYIQTRRGVGYLLAAPDAD